jgi:hypothetical protein
MSENTITIECKNGIVLMIPYKSISYHKRKGNCPHMPIDISGHESIEQRSSRFRGPLLDDGTKSSLLFLSLPLGVLSILLFILAWMI